MSCWVLAAVLAGGVLVLAWLGAPARAWAVLAALACAALAAAGSVAACAAVALLVLAPLLVLAIGPLRRALVIGPALRLARRLRLAPVISETERVALDAGSAWLESEVFAGVPDWGRILATP